MASPACVFCRIVAAEAPAVLIAETAATLAFVPLKPVCEEQMAAKIRARL